MSIIKNTEELNNLLDAVQKLPVKKDEQEKIVDITENGTTVVTPDEGMTLGEVTVNVAIESGGGTEEIETLIDQSGVLESTDGTITEKLNRLLEMAYVTGNMWTLRFPYNATLKDEVEIDCKKMQYLDYAFSGAKVKTIRLFNTQNVTSWGWAFMNCTAETIETLDFSACTSFNMQTLMCDNLKHLKIVPQTMKYNTTLTSTLLTAESKDNIFNGLAKIEVARTLTLPANLKILQSQVDSANAKGWTVAGGIVVSEEEYYG